MFVTPDNNENRRGFTLLEIMMVVAIIGFLAALSLAVLNGISEQAQVEATKTTVLKVSRILDQRIEAFDRAFKGPRQEGYVTATVGLLAAIDSRFDYFNDHPDEAPPAIRLLAYKAAFRFEMPQRIVEMNVGGGATPSDTGLSAAVTNSVTGLPNTIYLKMAFPIARQQLIEAGNTNPTRAEVNAQVSLNYATHQQHEIDAQVSDTDSVHSTESSELMYFMLTQSSVYGASTSVADEFTTQEVADTDQDGFPEFVDSWGHPLQFYRWPTRLFDPTAPNPFAPDFSDPNDATEVDPTPDNTESDGLREILISERDYAGLLVKGLPPRPTPIPRGDGSTYIQRDLMLVDPDDPVGILYTFIEDPKYKEMGIDLTLAYNEALFHTPDTYHAPLIVSAGPDERLGLREPNNTVPASGIYGNLAQYASTTATAPLPSANVVDHLFDNITNRNRRAGARR